MNAFLKKKIFYSHSNLKQLQNLLLKHTAHTPPVDIAAPGANWHLKYITGSL